MNDKEQKAVKDFRHTLDNPDTKFWIGTDGIKNIDIILNLIEKQKAEIEALKILNENYKNNISEITSLKNYAEVEIEKKDKRLNRQFKLLQKKDKEIKCLKCLHNTQVEIIDLMANRFAEEGFYSEHCQTLIDNDICPDDCNKCIKQYFEKKAEEDK